MAESILALRGIRKVFRTGAEREIRALDGVTLELNEGDIVLLNGKNGSGKTTLLNIVAGLEAPDSGDILLRGISMNGLPQHRRARSISYIRQQRSANLVATFSIGDVLMLANAVKRRWWYPLLWRRERRGLGDLMASDDRDLVARSDTPIAALSGGEHQRLTLLTTLSMIAGGRSFGVFLFDEHMSNLDIYATQRVRELTKRLCSEPGTASIIVAHGADKTAIGANRVVRLQDGVCVNEFP